MAMVGCTVAITAGGCLARLRNFFQSSPIIMGKAS